MKLIYITLLLVATIAINSNAQVINANSSNYSTLVSALMPGDTLLLAAGNYTNGLKIENLVGTASQPIVIMGSGTSTVFMGDACCNTVSIKQAAFVTLTNFTINGQNIANIDGVKAEGTTGNWAHHIVLDNLLIVGHGANQQTVGISTKCPTWDWMIKECIIDGAGTGIYLGNSNGEEPFVNGIIEYNLIKNTIGYNMEIKHQNVGSRTALGMPANGKTIIRHNVFSKENNASTGGNARPNVLVGNYPASGVGASDYYEVYGNFFWQNPSESLFQGTGNVMFYDNVGVNYAGGNGATFQSHNSFQPRDIKVFHNTFICDVNWGIRLMDTDMAYQKYIYGNAVFSNHTTPIRIVGGGISTTNQSDNIVDIISNVNNYVNNGSNNISTIDLYPKSNSPLNASLIPNALFNSYSDFSKDFNATNRLWNYRGAYSGEGSNPGWQLSIIKKTRPTIAVGTSEFISKIENPKIQLFPNPANESVTLRFDNAVSNLELSIINLNGQVVFQKKYNTIEQTTLHTTGFNPGVYFIKIKSTDFDTTLKWVKQ